MADRTGGSDDPDDKAPQAPASRSTRATKAAGAASRARRIGGAGRSASTAHASRRNLPPVEQDITDADEHADGNAPEDAPTDHVTVGVTDGPLAGAEEADAEEADAAAGAVNGATDGDGADDAEADDAEADDAEADEADETDGVDAEADEADVEDDRPGDEAAGDEAAGDDAAGDDAAGDDAADDADDVRQAPPSLLKATGRPRADEVDPDDESDDQPGDKAAEGARTTRPGEGLAARIPSWARWAPAGLLIAGVIVMIVLILVAAHSVWYSKPSASAVRDQVLAAAKTCTARSNTYSYTSLDKDEAAAAACTTGKYTKTFTQAFNRLVKPRAASLKASQSVQINAAGIETVTHEQWTVVVYGQTKITQSGATPRTDPFAVEVVMQRAHGKWLIKNIKLPSATN